MESGRGFSGKTTALMAAILFLVVLVPLPGSAKAAPIASSTFEGTTYVNEHFVMEIGTEGATLTDVYSGSLLLEKVDWEVEEKAGDSWDRLAWTSGPNLTVESVGIDGEIHRVAVSGIMDDRLAVTIHYDGRPVDVPSMGPKISVSLQTLETYGTFRLLWSFSGFGPGKAQIEHRVGNERQLIRGPIALPDTLFHAASGDNSLVALSGREIEFGANWQDAIDHYVGIAFTRPQGQSRADIIFGEINLGYGEGFVLDPLLEGGGGGGGTPTVSIYNVNVDRNSLSGTETTITWSTSPSDASDKFEWGPTTSYGNTIYPSTHSVILTGLQTHETYYYKITSSKSGYYSGTKTGSWYPTDASLSKADESYSRTYTAWSLCGYPSVDYIYRAWTLGDIAYDPAKAGNSNNYEIFDLQLYYKGTGEPYCWPWTMTTRFTRVDLWIEDETSNVVDWIDARNYVLFEGYGAGSADVSLGVNVGGSIHGFQAGMTASSSPPDTPFIDPEIPNECVDQGGGVLYCGYFTIHWPGDRDVTGYVIWPLVVTDQEAQHRLWDQVRITVKFTMTFDGFGGLFGWYGNNLQTSWTIVLGNGNFNGANILDQYMNVQSGYTTGVE